MAKVITVKQMGEFMALYDERLKQILLDPNNIVKMMKKCL